MVTKVDSGVIAHDGGTIKDTLDKAKPIADYVALRAYTGSATQVRITSNGTAGFFYYDAADTTSLDNGGTIIVSANGKRWKRIYDGTVSVKWFGVIGDGSDETAKMNSALSAIKAGLKITLSGLKVVISEMLAIENKNNFIIDGEGGSITAKAGMPVATGKGLLILSSCEKFKVENITFDGNRANRTLVGEVAAQTVQIWSCKKFIFENVHSNNSVLDGYYFAANNNLDPTTYCLDFQMIGCYADNSYRNGASVINAYDFQFIGGAYTRSNGIGPQAGIDVESNLGATLGNARGLFRGVRFDSNNNWNLVLSNVGGAQEFTVDSCYFNAGGLGAIAGYADLTSIKRCVFKNHLNYTGVTQGGVVIFANSATIRGGSIEGCVFTGNLSTQSACIFVGAAPKNVRIRDNVILDSASTGIVVRGSECVVDGNALSSCASTAISMDTGNDSVITNNTIKNCIGRGIYDSTSRSKISNNKISNIASVIGAYIQAAGSDQQIFGNTMSSDTQVADYGIRVDGTALSVNGNICINLNTVDPYVFIGTAIDDVAYNNIGGTANDRRKVRYGFARPTYSTANRPPASAVAVGQDIFNVTTSKPNWSDGVNWYNADGTIA